jgi:biopolymer transport protein ExbD
MPKPLPTRNGTFAEINMIPLIDIALILLIIFMVLTPALVQSQLSVKLPKASQGEPANSSHAIEVSIAKDGRIAVNGRSVAAGDLERELTLLLARSADKTVLVQADKGVPIQSVVDVLDVGKKLGVGRLGIGVLPN